MTLPEIDLICRHNPEGKKTKADQNRPPMYGSAEWAIHLLKEQMAMAPREKLAKRLSERDG